MSDSNRVNWRLGNLLSRWLSGGSETANEIQEKEHKAYNSEASSAEGRIRVVPVKNGLEIYSTLSDERLLTIKASLAGPLSKFVKHGSGNEVVITVPVLLHDKTEHSVKISYFGPKNKEKSSLKLVRAGKSKNTGGCDVYEFVYSNNREDVRYTVEMEADIAVSDFKEVVDKRPIFSSIPSLAQMSAFLRAVINRKRTVFDVIDSLMEHASPTTMRTTAQLQDAVENQGVELSYEIPQRIKKLLAERGNVISEHVILALALYVDMEVGELKTSDISGKRSISASVASLYTVANYLGAKISYSDWKEIFGDTGVTLNEVQEKQLTWGYTGIVSNFGQLNSSRTPLEILQQIAKESSSMRTISFAKALQERLGGNDIAISDQQLALLATLSVARCHYSPNLVAALCLFVDAEVGAVKESDLASASIEIDGLETSTYAMLAVAGAFGVSLHGLNLGNLSEEELHVILSCLIRLTGVGFLGGFRKAEETKQNWHWVRTNQAAAKALKHNRGVEFTNNVLCTLPVIEQLSEIDLVHLAESGRDFVAAFQSDYDKNIVWRRLKEIPETSFRIPVRGKVRQSYSFIEGFSAYHFSRTIIGRLLEVPAKQLIGSANVIMVYHDNRDNRHYKFLEKIAGDEDLQPPPNTGWVWKGEIVDNIDISGLPSIIYEMSQSDLLGRDIQISRESHLLSLIFEALRKTALREVEYNAVLDYSAVCELLRERLPQLRETVKNYIDDYSFNTILDWLEEDSQVIVKLPLRIYNCLNDEAHVDVMCLFLLYSLASSEILDDCLGSYYKQVDLDAFRVLLNERIEVLLASEKTESRVLGLRFLTFREFVSDANVRLTVEYHLSQALEDKNSNIVFAACEGMVRLCMSGFIPLPNFTLLSVRETSGEEEEEDIEDLLPAGEAVIDRQILQDVNMELEDWIADLQKSKADLYKELPFVGIDGSADPVLLHSFARFVTVLRQVSYNEYGELPRRYYAITNEKQLNAVCGVVVETWRQMVKASGISLCKMLEESTPAELYIDQRFFVKGNEKRLYDTFGVYPYLGGPDKPITIYHLKPDEIVSPYRQVSRAFSATGKEESQFFLDLVRHFFAANESRMVLLSLRSVDGTELSELETFLSVFETSHCVDLRTAERFDSEHGCFIPVFRSVEFSDEQIGSTYEEKADFQALMGLLGGKKISLKREAAADAAAVDEASERQEDNADYPTDEQMDESMPHEPEFDELLNEDESGLINVQAGFDLTPFNKMADQFRKAFNLPSELDRQLVNMLLLVERHSQKAILAEPAEK